MVSRLGQSNLTTLIIRKIMRWKFLTKRNQRIFSCLPSVLGRTLMLPFYGPLHQAVANFSWLRQAKSFSVYTKILPRNCVLKSLPLLKFSPVFTPNSYSQSYLVYFDSY